MQVDEKNAQFKSYYKGKMYFFCGRACRDALENDPEKYLQEGPQ